jgi:hypothetical protein
MKTTYIINGYLDFGEAVPNFSHTVIIEGEHHIRRVFDAAFFAMMQITRKDEENCGQASVMDVIQTLNYDEVYNGNEPEHNHNEIEVRLQKGMQLILDLNLPVPDGGCYAGIPKNLEF